MATPCEVSLVRADFGNVGEDVKSAGRHADSHFGNALQSLNEQNDFALELDHDSVAFHPIVLQGGLPRQLHERRHAGNGRVEHFAHHLSDARAGDGIAQAPAAHAVRFAERIGCDGLVD